MRAMATLCLSGELMNRLEAIARAGFGGVEIFVDDLQRDTHSARRIGEHCRDLGLTVVALQPFRDAEGLSGEAHRRMLERAERHFDTLADLGGTQLLAASTTLAEARPELTAAADSLGDLAERAATRGMNVAYEALCWGRHVNDYRQAWEVVKLADHPALALVLDSYHVLAPGLALETLAELPASRIGLVQLADAPAPLREDLQTVSRHRRAFPGEGELEVERFIAALARTGYAGPISLEVFSDVLGVMPTGMTALAGWERLDRALQAAG
ncbi:sugar phosphate isomerase/epimerase family protein [Salinicola sp. JS01]|uniref:sugar phosphate isomerase/epimerase family protein n=1 Tax=Salinicola sp. JS01 TaxID=3050071 RepID=UPI00255BA4DF|nr:sugar phosphate isomerase/epimerase family protein [Salinicola sp. JS01]WIX33417.1 sugar phosphate isomerase/epimerase family protein [Salinicola sp. JS01]